MITKKSSRRRDSNRGNTPDDTFKPGDRVVDILTLDVGTFHGYAPPELEPFFGVSGYAMVRFDGSNKMSFMLPSSIVLSHRPGAN